MSPGPAASALLYSSSFPGPWAQWCDSPVMIWPGEEWGSWVCQRFATGLGIWILSLIPFVVQAQLQVKVFNFFGPICKVKTLKPTQGGLNCIIILIASYAWCLSR